MNVLDAFSFSMCRLASACKFVALCILPIVEALLKRAVK